MLQKYRTLRLQDAMLKESLFTSVRTSSDDSIVQPRASSRLFLKSSQLIMGHQTCYTQEKGIFFSFCRNETLD